MTEIRAEIFKYFIPQTELHSKNRSYLRWERGKESVEVQMPGVGIRKRGHYEKRPWIVASFLYTQKLKNGRRISSQITSSFEYDKNTLNRLLKELNRND